MEILHFGEPGDTTAGSLARLPGVLRLRPRIILLCLGGNDRLQGRQLGQALANLAALVDHAGQAGAFVVWLGVRSASVLDQHRRPFARPARLDLVALPPSSRELNPVEALGDQIKDRMGKVLWQRLAALTQAIGDELRPLHEGAEAVRRLISYPWQVEQANATASQNSSITCSKWYYSGRQRRYQAPGSISRRLTDKQLLVVTAPLALFGPQFQRLAHRHFRPAVHVLLSDGDEGWERLRENLFPHRPWHLNRRHIMQAVRAFTGLDLAEVRHLVTPIRNLGREAALEALRTSPLRHRRSKEFRALFGYLLSNLEGIDTWWPIPARLRRGRSRTPPAVKAGSGAVEKSIEVHLSRRFQRQGRSWHPKRSARLLALHQLPPAASLERLVENQSPISSQTPPTLISTTCWLTNTIESRQPGGKSLYTWTTGRLVSWLCCPRGWNVRYGSEDENDCGIPHARARHGFGRRADRPFDAADQSADGTPAAVQEGPQLTPGPLDDGQPAPTPARLSASYRPEPLYGDHQKAEATPVRSGASDLGRLFSAECPARRCVGWLGHPRDPGATAA